MKKRIVSAVMALLLCLTLLPTAALADKTSTAPSPVYVGGEQLLLNTKYVNDGSDSVKVSVDDGCCNAIVTYSDTDGYTLTLKGLNVTGKTNTEQFSYKSSAVYTETGKLTIVVEEASTVTGAQTTTHSAGVYAKGNLTITGSGMLTANGGKATGNGSGSYGVMCNAALTINTSLNASGGTAGESSVGVFASSITINGNNTVVTAVGGKGSWRSCGMGGSGSSICLNGGKVIASGNKNAIIAPFATDPQNGKEVRYLVGDDIYTDYNNTNVKDAASLTVTLGDPAPVFYTVTFYTNGGKLSGEGVTAEEPNQKYTMEYQKGVGIPELPKPTRDGYNFVGWYSAPDFAAGSGPDGSIGEGSNMNFTYYAKWEVPDFSEAAIHLGTQGIYNGTEQSVCITSVTLGGKALTKDVDYEIISGGTATNVENTTLTIRGKGVYTGTATTEWSLQKASPSLYVDFAQSVIDTLNNGVDYTGKPIRIAAPLKDGKSGMGRVDTYYKASGSQTAYSAAKDAGEYSVIFDIKEGTNYKAASLMVGTLTVKKIDYTGDKTLSVTVRSDKVNKDVAVTLPAIPEGASYGDVNLGSSYYAGGSRYPYTIFPSGQRGIEGNTLYFSTDPVRESGIYADITIPVTGAKNYNDYVITIRVTCEDRTTVSFSGIADNQSFVYDGTTKTPAGTLTVSDGMSLSSLEVQYEKVENETVTPISGAPTDIGSYQVTYSVPDSNENYRGSVTYFFTITPRPVTITVKDQSAYVGAAVPDLDESSYTVSGLIDGEQLTEKPTVKYVDKNGEEIVPNMFRAGQIIIRASGADAGANYEISYVDGTLTVSRRSSSSTSSTLYPITVKDSANGDAVSSVKSAGKGTPVTITVTPDKGYTLETIAVTDKDGKELTLTKKGDNQYTFDMPAGSVTVKVTFMDDNTMLNFFVDVKATDYFYDAVLWVAQKGITSGTDAEHFSPNQPCTRAQIVTFLWRAAGSPEPKNMSSFADVSADSYYAKAVAWAFENGITSGTSDTMFSPDETCTRAQMVTMLWRAAGSPEVSVANTFTDVPADSYYAKAVTWAVAHGITTGVGSGKFDPNGICTRAQIATFLHRSYQSK